MTPDPMMEDADSIATDEAAPADDLSQGYCIELCVMPDGSFVVSGPEPIEPEDDAGGQSAASLGEAMKMIMAIYKQAQADVGGSADDQMAAGFNRARGASM